MIILLGVYLLRKRRPGDHQGDRVNESSEITSPFPRTWDQRYHPQEVGTEQQWEMDGIGRSEVDGSGRLEMEARWRVAG